MSVTQKMSRRLSLFVFMLAVYGLSLSLPFSAQANVLVTDLSKDRIAIHADFSGETLLLFGAIDPQPHGPVDGIAVVLRGPGENIIIRQKQKQFGIWANGAAYPVGPLPGFMAVVSSTPLAVLAPEKERQLLGLGQDTLEPNMLSGTANKAELGAAMRAFLRLKTKDRLYNENPNAIEIIDERLFRAEIELPAGMPVGRYVTEFFAFKNGRLVGYRTGELPVDIVGAGHILHQAAYQQSLLYGLVGVVLAVLMGWGAAVLFRRR